MIVDSPSAAAGYARFVGWAVAVSAAVAVVGYVPAVHFGGMVAVPALLAGCGIAAVASALGGVPIALAGADPVRRPQSVLLSLALRLAAVLALGVAAVESGRFASRQLVVWTAIAYAAQLVVDSRYAMQSPRSGMSNTSDDGDSKS
jgi:hypothetical protein